ncbi:unnamed protein product [Pleuronectes platessa]|uniref:Protein kinase domain-containing protein n=1 Tax=Pleuronectes platessa TaxID=8262 RepID=A0A9N7TN09_PLEPL|nr:unnamed protein product [Pleuronectes platessa]
MASTPSQENQVDPGMPLTSGSSNYEVQSLLGQGSFGKVVKCIRLEDNKTVAIKMIKLQPSNINSANQEVAALKKLRLLDKFYFVQWYQSFLDRGHICLEFEHLDKSLLDFTRERGSRPVLLKEIRPIVQQLAHALNHLKAAGIVHSDLKLDNVMLVDHLREPLRVKLIDFGLAFEVSAAKLGSHLQARSYRSPEILLGHPFTEAIDMWSLGCMVARMYLRSHLYPGLGEYEMITQIMETQGQLPNTMLNHGCKTPHFFTRHVDSTTSVWKLKTPEEYRKETGIRPIENRRWWFTSLDDLLETRPITSLNAADEVAEKADGQMFVDMLKAMLQLDPDKRITPSQVLEHSFISMRHITSMEHKSHYVKYGLQLRKICQKKIPTSGKGTAMCGPLKPPQPPLKPPQPPLKPPHPPLKLPASPTNPVQQNQRTEGLRKIKIEHDEHEPALKAPQPLLKPPHSPLKPPQAPLKPPQPPLKPPQRLQWPFNPVQQNPLSLAEGRKNNQPHRTDLHLCTTTTSTKTRGTEGLRKMKIEHDDLSGQKRKGGDHDDVPPHKKKRLPSSNSTHDPCDAGHHQSDQRTRPADHRQNHNPGPSGSSRTEGQAISGQKRKGGDHDDGPPHKKNCLPS